MNNNKWFLQELQVLRSQEVIDEPTELALRKYYEKRLAETSGINHIMMCIWIVGIVSILSGIILFFNYNWDSWSKPVRLMLSSIPMLCGFALSLWALIKGKGQKFLEGSALLTAGGAAILIALISQIYQIQGNLNDYMTLVLFIAIPFVYIFNSIGLLALYIIGLFFTIHYIEAKAVIQLIQLALPLPFFVFHFYRRSNYLSPLRFLAMPLCVFSLFIGKFPEGPVLLTLVIFLSLGIQEGQFLASSKNSGRNPWYSLCSLGLAWTLIILSFVDNDNPFAIKGALFNPSLLVCVLASGLYLWSFLARPMTLLKWFLLGNVLFCLILTCLPEGLYSCHLFFNIPLLCIGIALLLDGIQKRLLSTFNLGLLFIIGMLAARFFDMNISALSRAPFFVGFGVVLLVGNLKFSKYLRNTQEAANETN